jgi:hypothetical protein
MPMGGGGGERDKHLKGARILEIEKSASGDSGGDVGSDSGGSDSGV